MLKNKSKEKKKSKLEKTALQMTMRKAFDNGTCKNEKKIHFSCITQNTHIRTNYYYS